MTLEEFEKKHLYTNILNPFQFNVGIKKIDPDLFIEYIEDFLKIDKMMLSLDHGSGEKEQLFYRKGKLYISWGGKISGFYPPERLKDRLEMYQKDLREGYLKMIICIYPLKYEDHKIKIDWNTYTKYMGGKR